MIECAKCPAANIACIFTTIGWGMTGEFSSHIMPILDCVDRAGNLASATGHLWTTKYSHERETTLLPLEKKEFSNLQVSEKPSAKVENPSC